MAREFQRGHKAKISDLTAGTDLYVGVQIAGPGLSFDISCFGLDAGERLSDDRYFIFFNQPKSPEESIQLLGAQTGDSESFRVTLDKIPPHIQKLSFTAALDGAGQVSQIGPGYLRIVAGGEKVARYSFNGSEFSTERAVMLGDFYLKDVWRFAAVGQGFDGGLEALLKNFGGEVAEEAEAQPEPTATAQDVPGFAPPSGPAAPAPSFGVPAAPPAPTPAPEFGPPQGAPQEAPPAAPQPPQPTAPQVHSAPTLAAPLAPPGPVPPPGVPAQQPPAPYGQPAPGQDPYGPPQPAPGGYPGQPPRRHLPMGSPRRRPADTAPRRAGQPRTASRDSSPRAPRTGAARHRPCPRAAAPASASYWTSTRKPPPGSAGPRRTRS